jgi:hypothetical protein
MKIFKTLFVLMAFLSLSSTNKAMAQSSADVNTNEAETSYAPIDGGGAILNPPPPNVVSIKESVKAELKLYPNPSSGNFNMETNLRGTHRLLIIDLAGNVHLQKEVFIDENGLLKVDLSSAARGLYLVNLGKTTLKFQKI